MANTTTIKIEPKQKYLYKAAEYTFLSGVSLMAVSGFAIYAGAAEKLKKITILNGIVSNKLFIVLFVIGLILFIINLFFSPSKVQFDNWVADIGYRRLGTTKIMYTSKKLYLHYDVSIGDGNLEYFINEINEKSTRYNYHLESTDIDKRLICIVPLAKSSKAPSVKKKSKLWSSIALGETQSSKGKLPFTWNISDFEKTTGMANGDVSHSLFVLGSDEINQARDLVLSHASSFPDKFQVFDIDIKETDFNKHSKAKGIVKNSNSIDETVEILLQLKNELYKRFEYMQSVGVNNIQKVGKESLSYTINKVKYSEDDYVDAFIDGNIMIMKTSEIIQKLEEGFDIRLDNKTVDLSSIKRSKEKYAPKSIVITISDINDLVTNVETGAAESIKESVDYILKYGKVASVNIFIGARSISSEFVPEVALRSNVKIIFGEFSEATSNTIFKENLSYIASDVKGRAVVSTDTENLNFDLYKVKSKDIITDKNKGRFELLFNEERANEKAKIKNVENEDSVDLNNINDSENSNEVFVEPNQVFKDTDEERVSGLASFTGEPLESKIGKITQNDDGATHIPGLKLTERDFIDEGLIAARNKSKTLTIKQEIKEPKGNLKLSINNTPKITEEPGKINNTENSPTFKKLNNIKINTNKLSEDKVSTNKAADSKQIKINLKPKINKPNIKSVKKDEIKINKLKIKINK